MQITPIAGALGADVSGIDLARPVSDEIFNSVHDALIRYGEGDAR